jgi:DNA-3-methyladenine glycosylase
MEFEVKQPVSQEFFRGRAIDIAEDLVGTMMLNEENGASGIIVETEAYLGEYDPSCHFAKSGESRKKVFRQGAGTVYVYVIHGHHCMNFISEYNGNPEGVLVRALGPLKRKEDMKQRRGREEDTELASGPGKLTEALDIKKKIHNGQKVSSSPISVYKTDLNPEIGLSARIGIKNAVDWPCRFLFDDNRHVSKPLKDFDPSFDIEKVYRRFG